MTPRRERALFVAAAVALWFVFLVQAVNAPILLDDWFQLRYWRDHAMSPGAIWAYAYHNYFHYNPRLGDVLLAIIDGSRAIHLIITPLVQLAALVTAFVIALGRWPRRTTRDLELLLFMQVMIWLVIPIPGIVYFYRPIATNYLWAFTITLALFVPYRLALTRGAAAAPARWWRVPVMLVLGWLAGMCNEHTGPAAMVAMAGFVVVAARRRQLEAWMVSGMIGLYVAYPMLFFAPGQRERYMGLATHATPTQLLAERGLRGCLDISWQFVSESRLGIVMFAAALVRYVMTIKLRGERVRAPARETLVCAGLLGAAAMAIVVTLFASPTTTDRVFYASGVLLVAAFACCAERLFEERSVRQLVVAACSVLFAYHAVRFVATYAAVKAENDARMAWLAAARPGTVARVPAYEHAQRTRWHLGDDFLLYPWLAEYVGTELYDLAGIDVGVARNGPAMRYRVSREYAPALDRARDGAPPRFRAVPTYRQWQSQLFTRMSVLAQLGPFAGHSLARFRLALFGLPFADSRHRPLLALAWTPRGWHFVDGSPYDTAAGHFIRIHAATLPPTVESFSIVGCGDTMPVAPVRTDDAVLLRVDERVCRGVFTAIACEPDVCWVAGWY
jgi:hypothetical protein